MSIDDDGWCSEDCYLCRREAVVKSLDCEVDLEPPGRKFDAGKPRPELMPPYAEEEVAKVLAFGATKYDDDNWRLVENAKKRYLGAARRHIIKYRKGEISDPESGAHALAHAVCSLMFVLELELEAAAKDVSK